MHGAGAVTTSNTGTDVGAPLIAYDRARFELVHATAVDQVKTIRDQADALRRYWMQRKDKAMEAAFSAIRLRADYEIGLRSLALETEITGRPNKKSVAQRQTFSGKLSI